MLWPQVMGAEAARVKSRSEPGSLRANLQFKRQAKLTIADQLGCLKLHNVRYHSLALESTRNHHLL